MTVIMRISHAPAADASKRSHLSAPHFVSDDLGKHLVCHADGKRYDSRSAMYRAIKDNGCHIVEHMTPKPSPRARPKRGSVAPDIKRAIEQLKAR